MFVCVCELLLTLDNLLGTGVIHLDLLGVGRQDSVEHVGLPLKQEGTGSLVKIKAGSHTPNVCLLPRQHHSDVNHCSDQRGSGVCGRVCECVSV